VGRISLDREHVLLGDETSDVELALKSTDGASGLMRWNIESIRFV